MNSLALGAPLEVPPLSNGVSRGSTHSEGWKCPLPSSFRAPVPPGNPPSWTLLHNVAGASRARPSAGRLAPWQQVPGTGHDRLKPVLPGRGQPPTQDPGHCRGTGRSQGRLRTQTLPVRAGAHHRQYRPGSPRRVRSGGFPGRGDWRQRCPQGWR